VELAAGRLTHRDAKAMPMHRSSKASIRSADLLGIGTAVHPAN